MGWRVGFSARQRFWFHVPLFFILLMILRLQYVSQPLMLRDTSP